MYIIFDLDETLLNYNRKVDDFTLCTLRYYQNKGHKLVINTARSLINTIELFKVIKPDYAILFGGAVIVDKDLNIIFESKIRKDVLNEVIKELENNYQNLSVETIDKLYCSDKDYHGEYFDFKNNYLDVDGYKIVFCSTNTPLLNDISQKYNLNLVTYSNLIWHRFVNKNVSKALGIKELLKITGDSLDDCITFGDDYGDIEMINISKVGVVMKNAYEDVKKQVNGFVCENNNDYGVARFLLKYFKEHKYEK